MNLLATSMLSSSSFLSSVIEFHPIIQIFSTHVSSFVSLALTLFFLCFSDMILIFISPYLQTLVCYPLRPFFPVKQILTRFLIKSPTKFYLFPISFLFWFWKSYFVFLYFRLTDIITPIQHSVGICFYVIICYNNLPYVDYIKTSILIGVALVLTTSTTHRTPLFDASERNLTPPFLACLLEINGRFMRYMIGYSWVMLWCISMIMLDV